MFTEVNIPQSIKHVSGSFLNDAMKSVKVYALASKGRAFKTTS